MVGGTPGFAAESEGRNVPVTRAPENDATTTTRREFETINSSRDPTMQQKGDVPRVTVPEMQAPSGAGWSPAKAKLPEKKSANWLVDAMEKSGEDRKRATRGQGERELDRARDVVGRSTGDDLKSEVGLRPDSEAADSSEKDHKPTATVVANPLNHYLGEWMTPQDYSLLKPGLTQSAMGGPGSRDSALLPIIQISDGKLLPGLDPTTGLLSTSGPGLVQSQIPKSNPYLETPKLPTSVSTPPVYAPPPSMTPSSLKPNIGAVPPPPPMIESAKSKVPDFAKPAQDEKYFKQLKRF